MKAHLTRRYTFSASHRLHNDQLSAEENLRTFGKCNNPFGHGHNYALEVTVGGRIDERTGMICDLAELDGVVEREVIEPFGHEHLNTLPPFTSRVPTSENLATEIFEILERKFPAAHLERVRLEETSLNSFEYAGGREIGP